MNQYAFDSPHYSRGDDNSDWWDGALIGLKPGVKYTPKRSHYDVCQDGPKRWVVHWFDHEGNEYLLTYSLDTYQRFQYVPETGEGGAVHV